MNSDQAVEVVQKFLRDHYTDQRLENLLEAARANRVPWGNGLMCLTGRSNHPFFFFMHEAGLIAYKDLVYECVGSVVKAPWLERQRCKKLVSLVEAEIERRAQIKLQKEIDSIPKAKENKHESRTEHTTGPTAARQGHHALV